MRSMIYEIAHGDLPSIRVPGRPLPSRRLERRQQRTMGSPQCFEQVQGRGHAVPLADEGAGPGVLIVGGEGGVIIGDHRAEPPAEGNLGLGEVRYNIPGGPLTGLRLPRQLIRRQISHEPAKIGWKRGHRAQSRASPPPRPGFVVRRR